MTTAVLAQEGSSPLRKRTSARPTGGAALGWNVTDRP